MQKNALSYLVCDSFDNTIFENISKRYKSTIHKDIISIEIDTDQYIILFKFGVFITWNASFENIKFFHDFIKEFEIDSLYTPIVESLSYEERDVFNVNFDKIVLDGDDVLVKIAISTSLAQNLKLLQFEKLVESSIKQNSNIPLHLAQSGKINLTRKDTAKKIGELFIVKSMINLHYDLLDTPEFFWDYPEYELYYQKVTNYLDIKARVDVLNKKVEVIQELLDMLSNEQNHRYSSFLEWIIIILIGVEIVMGLWDHFK